MAQGPYDFKNRPLACGLQISMNRSGGFVALVGTIGCFVKSTDGSDTKLFGLTVGHLLNASLVGEAPADSQQVYQPTSFDAIGNVNIYAPQFGNVKVGNEFVGVDAGLVHLDSGVSFQNYAWRIGPITGTAPAVVGSLVMKHGRTTGLTYGRVRSTDALANYPFSNPNVPNAPFKKMIMIEYERGHPGDEDVGCFANEGDSGAPVVDENRKLIGIVAFKQGSNAIVCPIDRILSLFGMQLAPDSLCGEGPIS